MKVTKFLLINGQILIAEVRKSTNDIVEKDVLVNIQELHMTDRGPVPVPITPTNKEFPIFKDAHIVLQYDVDEQEALVFKEFIKRRLS